MNNKIPLIKPYITQEIKDKVCEVLDSGYITEGPVTRDFENIFRDYIGCSHALAVTSCTTGLEMALRVLGIGSGDEVIVPDYTYPATASVVNIVGATSVIVDVDPKTMLIDLSKVERAVTNRTKVIIPVSIFGNPLDYDRLNAIKKKYDLYIIEDAACSIGAEYKGQRIGKHADISVFSLHPRKFITTGEGGIIATDNTEWAEWMFSYKHFGMAPDSSLSTQGRGQRVRGRESIGFEMIGTNYKLSNIQAAVGLVQMRYIDELLEKRRLSANEYMYLLRDCPKVVIPETTAHGLHSYQSFCIFVPNRDRVMSEMCKCNIEVQIGTYSLHMHKAFSKNPNCRIVGPMEGSYYAFNNCLTLPLYHELSKSDQQYVVAQLINTIK